LRASLNILPKVNLFATKIHPLRVFYFTTKSVAYVSQSRRVARSGTVVSSHGLSPAGFLSL
jgi:hypothetical protein